MGKLYRTANGKMIDMDRLMLQNERAPAVGNTRVNARGDEIFPNGEIRRSRAEVQKQHNKLHTMVPSDEPLTRTSNLTPDNAGDDNEG